MKKCPYCAEEIQEEAVICRFCRFDLKTGKPVVVVVNNSPVADSTSPQKVVDTHKSSGKAFQLLGIIVMLIGIPACFVSLSAGSPIGMVIFFIGFFLAVIGRFLE